MKMFKVLIVYILIAIISFISGLNIGLSHSKIMVCPPPEEYENKQK